jgi:hypothetical protein
MSITVKMSDGSLSGSITQRFNISIPSYTTTARQLIEQRITQEVTLFKSGKKQSHFNSVMIPTPKEMALNSHQFANIDVQAQCQQAIHVFSHNGFFLLVDDHQITELDTEFQVSELSTIQFIKLVPLVGG